MSLPPLCETCGTKHHSYQGHVFPASPSRVKVEEVKPALASAVKPVKPPAAEAARSNKSWRERDPEAYRAYMKEYMARRRAAWRVSP